MRRAGAGTRPRRRARRSGRPTRARSCSRSRTAAASACGGCRVDARDAPSTDRRRRRRSAASRNRATARCSRSSARRRMHPPALFACRGDGSGERAIETLNRALLARHAIGDVREVTIKGWGGEPVQMWSSIRRTSIRRRSGRCCIRSTAGRTRRISDRLAFPLEHAGVRGPGLRRRGGQLSRLVRLRPEMAGDDHRPLRRKGIRRRRGRHRLAAAAGLHRPHAARRDRRQLRRLHGRVHERPYRPVQGISSATPAATTGSA